MKFPLKTFSITRAQLCKDKKEKKRDKLHWSIFDFQIFFNFAKFTEFNDKKDSKAANRI